MKFLYMKKKQMMKRIVLCRGGYKMKKKKSRKELRKELEQKERDNSLKDESKSDDFL